jgi:hypothetical protein
LCQEIIDRGPCAEAGQQEPLEREGAEPARPFTP